MGDRPPNLKDVLMARIKQSTLEDVQQNTRDLLLQAAAVAFAKDGYDAANINQISLNAGFAKGTVYNYFQSKRILLITLIDEVAAAHCGFMMEQISLESDPQQRLEKLFGTGFVYVKQNIAKMRAILNILYGHDIELKTRLFQAYQPIINYVKTEILRQGAEQGEFEPVNENEFSLLILSLYMGLSTQADEQGNIWISADRAANLLLNGLLKR
jgi:AcrR family transcriptional regulator